MSRILVTGAHGFIGRHLSRELAEAGHEVLGLGHGTWPESDARSCGVVAWLNGDITPANLRRLQKSSGSPDAVVHLAGGSSVGAALASPREDFFRTVVSTAELLDWLRLDAPDVRLIAISSAAVYGDGHAGSISEDAPLRPYSPYGFHKRAMEELCQSYASNYGIQVGIARLFSVYGPHLRKQLLWDLCSRLQSGDHPVELGGTGDELRDWTDVRDVVRALRGLCEGPDLHGHIVNLGTGIGTSVRDIATLVCRHWSDRDNPVSLGFSGKSRPGDPFSLIASPTRLGTLGFLFEWSVDAGLADYVRWFRSRDLR